MSNVMHGVWTGPRLTNLEKLCIRSFQANGHEFHLYVTEPTEGIPEGTIVHSTNEVVPEGSHKWFSNPGHFGDYFRYHAVYKFGGWYTDTDIVCLKSFDFPDPYVFVSECPTGGPSTVILNDYLNSCLFKAPAGSALLKNIIDEIDSRDPKKGCNLPFPLSDINLGNGPPMFRRWVPKMGLEQYIKPPYVFDGYDWNHYSLMFDSRHKWTPPEGNYAIHLRGSFWRYNNWDPDGHYGADGLYELLKKKFGVGAQNTSAYFTQCPYCPQKFDNEQVYHAHQCPNCVCRECGKLHHTANDAAFCQRICGARNRALEERKRRGLQ